MVVSSCHQQSLCIMQFLITHISKDLLQHWACVTTGPLIVVHKYLSHKQTS